MNNIHTFAHLSDAHIGAFRDPFLRQLVLDAFVKALEICIQRRVDFIIIGGDLFDSNLPDMSLVDKAVTKMAEVRKNGINIYIVYGSHDFSPNQSSVVDILASANLFDKITKGYMSENKLRLEFKINERTGAKLVGISGMKAGHDIQYYNVLDRETLEKAEGFKLFVFHGMISEYKPDHLSAMDSMPISYLPKNFSYYAGGHLHERATGRVGTFDNVVYPGALFGADLRDVESSAKGQKRGFYIVTFSDTVLETEFVEVPIANYVLLEYNAEGKSSFTVEKDLERLVEETDVENKLVILKVKGELTSGKTADINFSIVENMLRDMGAVHSMISRSQLTSIEYSTIKITEYNTKEIEERIFKENIRSSKAHTSKLKGESGMKLSILLLETLRHDRKHNEVKNDYETRIVNDSINVIGLTEELDV